MISRLQQEKLQTSSADRFHKHLTFHHSIFLSKIKIRKNGKIFIRKKVVIHNRKKERIFRADKKMIQHICNKKPLKNGIKNYGFSCKKKFFCERKKIKFMEFGVVHIFGVGFCSLLFSYKQIGNQKNICHVE